MAYTGFRNLKKTQPEIDKIVEVGYMVTGAGAPERMGWVTKGRLRESGIWSLRQNLDNTVDFKTPTHWREIKE